ncbi:MAG: hypothetical protein R3C44_20370 [Chloroflexota bacterium]
MIRNLKKWALIPAMLIVPLIMAMNVSAMHYDVQGVVYIDENLNGVWDVGEPGYDGEWQWVEDEEVYRYVGATVTVTTPAYDEITVESSPARELGEDETIACTQQDLVLDDGEINPNPVRPCSGTWGLSVTSDDTYLSIALTAPDGYMVTSANPQTFLTGTDTNWVDFGIAPIGATAEDTADSTTTTTSTEETAATATTVSTVSADTSDSTTTTAAFTYSMVVEGTGFIPGLVFIDSNENGVWDVGEAGYGGTWEWVEDEEVNRYVGATITFVSPAYDAFAVESSPYRELGEDETITCTQQDLVLADGEINPTPVRPCSGVFGLSHAGDDVTWEVWLTVPDGYRLTSANPQTYVTGSGEMPIDFGIVPIAE